MGKGEPTGGPVVSTAGASAGRLNPFAFPSDTDFRFWLLIVSVVSASLSVHESLLRDWLLPAHLFGLSGNLRLTCFEVIDAQIADVCVRTERSCCPGSSEARLQRWGLRSRCIGRGRGGSWPAVTWFRCEAPTPPTFAAASRNSALKRG